MEKISLDEFHSLNEHTIHNAFAFIGARAMRSLAPATCADYTYMIENRPRHKWHEYGNIINALQIGGLNFKHVLRIVRLKDKP